MGVRLAIGASRAHILGLVLRDALTMLAIGSVAGVVLIAATTVFTRRFLYDTSPNQFSVAIGAFLTLVSVALLASLLPAVRAARLNPNQVLREE
jgi:ABC-type antimicrobial peptide transport system permease subunit